MTDVRPPCPDCLKRAAEYRRNQEARARPNTGKRQPGSNSARRLVTPKEAE